MSADTGPSTGQSTDERLVYMANQIATFFESMPDGEGIPGVAQHINDFWEPRMRTRFFELIESGQGNFKSLVLKAATHIQRP